MHWISDRRYYHCPIHFERKTFFIEIFWRENCVNYICLQKEYRKIYNRIQFARNKIEKKFTLIVPWTKIYRFAFILQLVYLKIFISIRNCFQSIKSNFYIISISGEFSFTLKIPGRNRSHTLNNINKKIHLRCFYLF